MPDPVNVDPRETEKFGRISALWWDPKGPMHSLHDINPLRTSFITQAAYVRGRPVLDVGCGGGLLTESLSRAGARVTGIDLSADLIEMARQHAREQGLAIDYQYVSAEQLAERAPAAFDVVTCMEVLEHIPEPKQVVAACARLLKPGGHAIFSTLDRTPKSLLFAIIGAEYVLRLLPVGSHSYHSLIRPHELRTWAQRNGLSFARSASVVYNPLTREFSVTQRHDVSYMMDFVRN